MNARHTLKVARSASACAILGLLAYRAGHPVSDRPATLTEVWQLDAWQQGWTSGYDSDKRCHGPKQAYGLAYVSLINDV